MARNVTYVAADHVRLRAEWARDHTGPPLSGGPAAHGEGAGDIPRVGVKAWLLQSDIDGHCQSNMSTMTLYSHALPCP